MLSFFNKRYFELNMHIIFRLFFQLFHSLFVPGGANAQCSKAQDKGKQTDTSGSNYGTFQMIKKSVAQLSLLA